MTVVTEILNGLQFINKPQYKFLSVLFSTMLVVSSKINFLALSRYSALSERTFRRQFQKSFDFTAFNLRAAEQGAFSKPIAFAQDASLIQKSGKKTFGLAKFWNSIHSCSEKGLEISLIALLDPLENVSFALSAEQTPAHLPPPTNGLPQTRIDFYLQHLRRTRVRLPASVRYGVVDGFYAKEKFVSGVCELGLEVISKFRADANLRYRFAGNRTGKRGRPQKFDGKVDFADLSRRSKVESKQRQVSLFTKLVWAVSLKREVRLCLVKTKKQAICLFSTDLELAATEILRLYRARFSIEFLFRDAKQSAGLSDCQARDEAKLSFHFSASLATVNIARLIAAQENKANQELVFSMQSIKQRMFNEHWLELFISKLGLDPTLIKNHEQYENLRNYAVMSP